MAGAGADGAQTVERPQGSRELPEPRNGAIFGFLGRHPLSGFMAERSGEIADVIDRWALTPVGVDVKITRTDHGEWVPQRVVRQFSGRDGGGILIWSRKAGKADLWRFPEDPYLPGLADWWRSPCDAEGRGLTDLKVLRYVPTRRVTIAATRVVDGRTERIIVKFKRRSKIDHSAAMLSAVYKAARDQDPTLAIARPIDDLPESSAFCQSFLDGEPFEDHITTDTIEAMMTRAGAIHARLHALEIDGVPAWNSTRYFDTVDGDIDFIGYLLPQVGRELRSVWPRLREALDGCCSGRVVFCHGDFVPGQMLCSGDATAVTDFDMARSGLDLQEIAKWIASLKYHVPLIARALSRDMDEGLSLLRRAEVSYLDGYSAQSSRSISLDDLRLYIAAADIHYLGVRLKKGLYAEANFKVALDNIAASA